ncbi:MAG: hypothetical protein JXR84_06825 [Anaerolineae bacterium]|nr:hypothetical protein [Anaerolineae bacterium]
MENENRHIKLVGPTILIGIGIILLLDNLGYLDWSFWDVLNLWPILLVASGLELLVGRRSLLGAFISAIIVLGLFAGGIWFASTSEVTRTTAQAIEIREPRDDITAARVTLAPAVAQINVQALNDSGNFVEGTALHRPNERVTQSFTRGDPARLTVKTNESVGFTTGPGKRYAWDFSFAPDVSLDLSIDTGMGNVALDLRSLTLESVSVDAGMGVVTIKLPETGEFDVSVDSGMGTVVIEVPAGLGVRLQTDSAIVGRNIPAGYTHNNNRYTSPNYETAENRADIQVDLGLGSITIREVSD